MAKSKGTKFKAFLSYSHKDHKWGRWLQKTLESYKVDRDLVGRETEVGVIPPNLRPIFVDRDDFVSGFSLKEATRHAIEASEFLIVICSPHAAGSYYVNEEVRLFKALGRSSRILPIIVDGEPGNEALNCFPPSLRFEVGPDGTVTDVPAEPIAADARDVADGRDAAKLKVIAGLLGVGLDEIRKRAARTARRRVMALSTVAATMGLLAIAAGGMAWVAHLRKIEAEQRLDWALQTAGSITSKATTFRNKFGVPAPVLTELLQEVEQLLGRLTDQGVRSRELTAREAILLDALSDANVSLGNTAKGLENARAAEAERATLANDSGHLQQDEYNLAATKLKVGDILFQQNKTSEALNEYQAANDVFKVALTKNPSSAGTQTNYANSLSKLGMLYNRINIDKSRQLRDEEVLLRRELVRTYPDDKGIKFGLAIALNDRAQSAGFASDMDQTPLFLEALSIESELVQSDLTNVSYAENLAYTQQNLGYYYERQGKLTEAIDYYGLAIDGRKKLSELDPSNVQKLDHLISVVGNIANAYSSTGQLALAQERFAQVVVGRRKIIALDKVDDAQKSRLIISLAQLGKVQSDSGNTSAGLSNIEEAVHIGSELIDKDPHNTLVKAAVALDLGFVSFLKAIQGDTVGSIAASEKMIVFSEQLADDDPTNALKEMEVFFGRIALAVNYRQQGKRSESLKVLMPLQSRAEHHAQTNDTVWLNVLSQFYNQLYASTIDENAVAASTAAAKCLEFAKRWIAIDGQNSIARQAVGNGYTDVGISARFLGNLDDSQKSIESGLAIRKELSERDASVFYKADLATSWSQLNAVFWDKADYARALDAEREALQLREQIVAIDPKNLEVRVELANSFSDVSAALERLDRKIEAREVLSMALKTRQQLALEQPDRRDFVEAASATKARLSELDQNIRSAVTEADASPDEKK